MKIVPIAPGAELFGLLSACDLAVSDIVASETVRFYGCRENGILAGAVGLEIYGAVALLRSLAVTPAARGTGLGRALVRFTEQEARSMGVGKLLLLTDTADGFFAGLGYRAIPREQAPAAIAGTAQFTVLCPASSRLLGKPL